MTKIYICLYCVIQGGYESPSFSVLTEPPGVFMSDSNSPGREVQLRS